MLDRLALRPQFQVLKALRSLPKEMSTIILWRWARHWNNLLHYRALIGLCFLLFFGAPIGAAVMSDPRSGPTLPLLALATMAAAAVVFFVGHVVVYSQFARERLVELGYCTRCGYNLTGAASGQCAECGEAMPEATAEALADLHGQPWPAQIEWTRLMTIEREIARRVRRTRRYWLALAISIALPFIIWIESSSLLSMPKSVYPSPRMATSIRHRIIEQTGVMFAQCLPLLLAAMLFRHLVEPARRRIHSMVCAERCVCAQCFAEFSAGATVCSACGK